MFLLRLVVFLILVSLVVILAYPLLIIFNISNGGDGFGLCNDLITCEIPFIEGPRILVILIILSKKIRTFSYQNLKLLTRTICPFYPHKFQN